jgi:cytoskeletal protein CcmA (bactofilin family)
MAMFDKHKSSKQTPSRTKDSSVTPQAPSMSAPSAASPAKVAMIGQGITIAGDINADTDLKVDGHVQGRIIQSTKCVEIGEPGQVVANIKANVVKVGGEMSGDILGHEKVTITRTGRVQGNIVAPRVVLEDGSLFRGSIEMSPTVAAEKKSPAAKPAAADAGARSAKAEPTPAKAAVAAGARKEPGLTLKSG